MFFNRLMASSLRNRALFAAGAASCAVLTSSPVRSSGNLHPKESKIAKAIQCQAPSVTWINNQAYLRPNTPGSKAQYPYVVVGMGTAAYSAISAIRANKPEAEILMLVDEKLVQSHASITSMSTSLLQSYNEWRRGSSAASAQTEQYIYRTDLDKRIQVHLYSSVAIDPQCRTLQINGGELHVAYDRCLVATAGAPRVAPELEMWSRQDHRVNTLSTPSDWIALDMLGHHIPVMVSGGGMLGTEIACTLKEKGHSAVLLAFPEDGLLRNYIPKRLSYLLSEQLKKAGITIRPETPALTPPPVDQLEAAPSTLSKAMGAPVEYLVVASTYVEPDVSALTAPAFVHDSTNGAVIVNKYLEAGNGVFVAGNAMSYDDVLLGKHRRAQRFDHAVQSGLIAGHNMSSGSVCPTCHHVKREDQQLYTHQPVLHSHAEFVGLDLLAVGQVDSTNIMVGMYNKTDPAQAIVYYIDNRNKVVGALTCNMNANLDIASAMLGRTAPAGAAAVAWLTEQYSEEAAKTGREDTKFEETSFDLGQSGRAQPHNVI